MQYQIKPRSVPSLMIDPPRLPESRKFAPAPHSALLIIPFYPKSPWGSFGKHVLTPSLALTTLAANTPAPWKTEIWDENLLQGSLPVSPFPSAVGITVHISFASRAYRIADWYRAHGAKVILGGPHVESCAEEALLHADSISLGNGALTWGEFLRDCDAGNIQSRYTGSFSHPYCEEAPPKRSTLQTKSYLTTASLIATRGCHNRCNFCYLSTTGLKMPFQERPPEDVAAELKAVKEPYGVFLDNNLGSNPAYLLRLCRALAPVEKIWSAAVSLDLADHPAVIREMALSGCTGVFIGFESLEFKNLSSSNKRSPSPGDYERRIDIFRSVGIEVNGSFVLGFDHDTGDSFIKLVNWLNKVKLTCATFHILTPYPGTPLFRQYEAEGRILHRDWDLYDTAHCVFKPRNMSPEELERGYQWCYQELFSHRSILARCPEAPGAWPAYFAMTYLYKRANRLWPFLIRRKLVHQAWSPLVELARRRNLRSRRRLLRRQEPVSSGLPVSASV